MKFISKMTTMGDRVIITIPSIDRQEALKFKGKYIKVEVEEITI